MLVFDLLFITGTQFTMRATLYSPGLATLGRGCRRNMRYRAVVQTQTATQGWTCFSWKPPMRTFGRKRSRGLSIHTLSSSPIPEARYLGSLLATSDCPTCSTPMNTHKPTGFESESSGFPLGCSANCHDQFLSKHSELDDKLRSINLDLHYLRTPSVKTVTSWVIAHAQEDRTPSQDTVPVPTDWTKYLDLCGFPDESPEAARHVSHLLSYVMTMTYALDAGSIPKSDELHIGVIGARAEASMPMLLWNVMFRWYPQLQRLRLTFIGPEVQRPPSRPQPSRLSSRHVQKYYHEITKRDLDTTDIDVYFLFNPGIGNTSLKDGWEPSLRSVLRTESPIFLTAFNEQDHCKDLSVLNQLGEEFRKHDGADLVRCLPAQQVNDKSLLPNLPSLKEDLFVYYVQNPYKSLKYNVDRRDLTMLAQTNSHIVGVALRR